MKFLKINFALCFMLSMMKLIKGIRVFSIFLCYFLFFKFVGASVLINEIMYDLPGTDTGREWIELYNDGGEAVDMSKWTLREAETNHKLEVSQGSAVVPANSYAVVADTPSKFLADNPGFSGTIFDSSFSLSNTGETLVLRSGDADMDTVSYSSDTGGAGDGMSLNRNGGGFKSGNPTPGAMNTSGPGITPPASTTTTSTDTTSTSSNNSTSLGGGSGEVVASHYKTEQQIFPDAGKDRSTLLGSETVFVGSALGVNKEPLPNAHFVWNFGDGEVREGRQVAHTYHFLGEYIVTLDVTSGEYSQGDRVLIKVVDPTLSISQFIPGKEGYTEIKNNGTNELDISRFQLEAGDTKFLVPSGTLIGANKTIKIANSVSQFLGNMTPTLFYASGLPVPSRTIGIQASVANTSNALAKIQAKSKTISSSNVATVVNALESQEVVPKDKETKKDQSKTWVWLMGVLAFCGVVSGAVVYVRRTREEVDQYTILEDEE